MHSHDLHDTFLGLEDNFYMYVEYNINLYNDINSRKKSSDADVDAIESLPMQ